MSGGYDQPKRASGSYKRLQEGPLQGPRAQFCQQPGACKNLVWLLEQFRQIENVIGEMTGAKPRP